MKTVRKLLSAALSLVMMASAISSVAVSASAAGSGIDSADYTASGISAKTAETELYGTRASSVQDISITGTDNYEYAFEVLELVNQERQAAGLSPLVMNQSLLDTAMQRAAETSAFFSHSRPDGTSCFSANPLMIAENIAAGQRTPEDVMNSWMNSSGHKANILSGRAKTIGIGCFEIGGYVYWVQCFGSGNDTASCPKPQNTQSTKTISLATGEFEDFFSGETYSYSFSLYRDTSLVKASTTVDAVLCLHNPGFGVVIFVDNDGVTWSSSSDYVATVDSSGKITGHNNGDATITASLGNFSASANITVYGGTESVPGDVNNDGEVTLVDAIEIQKATLALRELTGQARVNADVDADGRITLLDAIIVQKMAVGLQ